MKRRRGLVARCSVLSILVVAIHSAAAPSTTQPTTEPTIQPATRPATTRSAVDIAMAGHAELATAITVLTREYTQHLRDSHSTARSASSYFQDVSSPDVTEEAIADKLTVRRLSGDARVDAYVKWQLLSGIASPARDTIAGKLLSAYHVASVPAILPGLDPASRLQFERQRTLVVRDADVDSLDQQIRDTQLAAGQANTAIIEYRDSLFAKLPPTYDASAAGLQDANLRLNAGADSASLEPALLEEISKWMDDPKATSAQLTSLASAIMKLTNEKVSYIAAVKWDDKKRQAKFEEKSLSLKEKVKWTTLIKDMRTAAENRPAH